MENIDFLLEKKWTFKFREFCVGVHSFVTCKAVNIWKRSSIGDGKASHSEIDSKGSFGAEVNLGRQMHFYYIFIIMPPKISDFRPKVGTFWGYPNNPKSADFWLEISNFRG